MNLLDMETVIINHVLVSAICAAMIALLWLRNRGRFRGLGLWVGGYVAYVMGALIMMLRVVVSNLFSIVIGYALFVGGTILLYMGLERFIEKRGQQLQNGVLVVAFIVADIYFTVIDPNLDVHIASISVAMLLISAQSAWLIFRRADAEMRSFTRGVGVVFIASCLIHLTRLILFITIPAENSFFHSNAYETSQLILSQVVIIALAFSLFLTVNHKLVADLQRNVSDHERRVDELDKSETLFRQMFTEHSAVKLLIDPANGNIIDANPAAARFYGYPIDKLLMLNMTQINTLTPAEILAAFQDARQYKRNAFVFQHRLASGKLRDVEVHSTPIQVHDRQLLHSIIYDITERNLLETFLRRRSDMLAALHQVTLDLVNRRDIDDILQTLMVKIGALVNATDISFDLVEKSDILVTHAATPGQPLKKGDSVRRGEGGWLSWEAIDSGKPAVLEDYATWSKRRSLHEGHPIHAIMIIPIQQRDHVIGAINISRSEKNKPFNDADIYVAKQLGQMVALALDNAQVYTQLQFKLAESVQREEFLHEAQAQLVEQQRTMATSDERQRMARDLHDSVNQSIHSLVLFSETLVSTLDKIMWKGRGKSQNDCRRVLVRRSKRRVCFCIRLKPRLRGGA